MKVNYGLLLTLNHIYQTVPVNTPRRLHHVYECIESVWHLFSEDALQKETVIIDVGDQFAHDLFTLSPDSITTLSQYFPISNTNLPEQVARSSVVMPTTLLCCSSAIKIDGRHATTSVYTRHGLLHAKMFHGKCSKCSTVYYHGFSYSKLTNERTYDVTAPYMFVTSAI